MWEKKTESEINNKKKIPRVCWPHSDLCGKIWIFEYFNKMKEKKKRKKDAIVKPEIDDSIA